MEHDLQDLASAVGLAAREAGTAVALFIDELQYVKTRELGALIAMLHRMAQEQLPLTLVGAGLPQLRGRVGEAKSYAERLFDIREIGALPEEAARLALVRPASEEGVAYEGEAVARIIGGTEGYPYFLQEWGKAAWDAADASPIELADVEFAAEVARSTSDDSFFRVRFDRLTPMEKVYLRAMADLGAGPHRSGEIAGRLKRKVESVAFLRNSLVAKGMIWSPSHGDTAFTVPLFGQFMRRIMPGDDWKE